MRVVGQEHEQFGNFDITPEQREVYDENNNGFFRSAAEC